MGVTLIVPTQLQSNENIGGLEHLMEHILTYFGQKDLLFNAYTSTNSMGFIFNYFNGKHIREFVN
jgi:hypothetical protein